MNVSGCQGAGKELQVEAAQPGPGGPGGALHMVVKDEVLDDWHVAEGGEKGP